MRTTKETTKNDKFEELQEMKGGCSNLYNYTISRENKVDEIY